MSKLLFLFGCFFNWGANERHCVEQKGLQMGGLEGLSSGI